MLESKSEATTHEAKLDSDSPPLTCPRSSCPLPELEFVCNLLGLWHESYQPGSSGVRQLVDVRATCLQRDMTVRALQGSCSEEVSLRFVNELADLAAASIKMDMPERQPGALALYCSAD